jgi:hypothetical protein
VRQQCLGTRIDDNPLVGDAKRVLAPQIAAASQLMDLQNTFRLSAVKFCLKLDNPVHQRVLGRALGYAGQKQHRAIRDRSLSLQFVDEFLELTA